MTPVSGRRVIEVEPPSLANGMALDGNGSDPERLGADTPTGAAHDVHLLAAFGRLSAADRSILWTYVTTGRPPRDEPTFEAARRRLRAAYLEIGPEASER